MRWMRAGYPTHPPPPLSASTHPLAPAWPCAPSSTPSLSKGECPDYRWAFTGSAPSGSQLCAALAQLRAATPPQPGCPPGAHPLLTLAASWPAPAHSTEPLDPHVCSLALLPLGAQELLPRAVRHLMSEDSPLSDLYTECKVSSWWE